MNEATQQPEVEEQVFEPPPFVFVRPAIVTTTPPEEGWEEGYPKVFYNVFERTPPVVVLSKADEDAWNLNKLYWMTIPPEEPEVEPPV
jgi:hypothetical protein